ncbi:hypothetical protein D3C71_1523470 [compost metagenome]
MESDLPVEEQHSRVNQVNAEGARSSGEQKPCSEPLPRPVEQERQLEEHKTRQQGVRISRSFEPEGVDDCFMRVIVVPELHMRNTGGDPEHPQPNPARQSAWCRLGFRYFQP